MGRITNLNNINPAALERKFDTDAWDGLYTESKFMRVGWESDYSNIVDWTSEEMRDNYINQDFGEDQLVLDPTEFNLKDLMKWIDAMSKYAGTYTINLPVEAVNSYNYLAVTFKYSQPVPGPSTRETKYYFFVKSVNFKSANATELYLQLDVWTTYKFLVEINGLQLEQGHYPLANTDTDTFLANPLNVSIDITAPEVDLPSVKPLVSKTDFISLAKENPRVCIATTASLADLSAFWSPAKTGTPDNSWWNGAAFGWGGSSPVQDVNNSYNHGNNPSQLRVFSVAPADYNTFINTVRAKAPQIVKTFKAVYVLPEALINESAAFSVYGINVKTVTPQVSPQKLAELNITKSLFNYDSKYENYAKMYTGQFAEIVISSATGENSTLTVEELAGKLEFYARANAAFPFLKLEAFVNGIGGSTSKNYTVAPFNSATMYSFDSRWKDFRWELDVPVYSVFLDPRENAAMTSSTDKYTQATDTEAVRDNQILQRTTESANNISNYLNARDNAKLSADLAKENDKRSSLASKKVAYATANDNYSIGKINAEFTEEITKLDADNNRTNAGTIADNENDISKDENDDVHEINKEQLTSDKMLRDLQAIYDHSVTLREMDYDNDSIMGDITSGFIGSLAYADSVGSLNGEYANYLANHNIQGKIAEYQLQMMGQSVANRNSPINALSSRLSEVASNVFMGNSFSSYGKADLEAEAATQAMYNIVVNNIMNEDWEPSDIFTWSVTDSAGTMTFSTPNNAPNDQTFSSMRKAADLDRFYQSSRWTLLEWPHRWDLAKYVKDSADDLSEYIHDNNKDISSSQKSKADAIAGKKLGKAHSLANTIKTQAHTRAGEVLNNSIEVLGLARSLAKTNADTIKTAANTNADRVHEVASVIRVNNKETAELVNSRTVTQNNLNINLERDIKSREWNRKYAEMLAQPAFEAGSSSGPGHTDQWGMKGIYITVNRISKAAEKLVGDQFKLKGYSVDNLLIESPKLSQMSEWTFWKVTDIWTDAGALNDANEAIIRDCFVNGCTIWKNPDNVKKINLTNSPEGVL